ncbi:unnamed protein product [Penicillium olsonii]|uniref:Methyltransferase domain-containing protein n=1 Tax=Penicillium olsonii TaxID=99116 RepID=A0A9W4MQ72_PENOL|nr:unnamed protein product [Penicillium olsonii]
MTQTDDYVLGRGIADSIRLASPVSVLGSTKYPNFNMAIALILVITRLDAQHLLWKLYRGHDLHPLIPMTDGMKIAELGTGTASWIFGLARQLPPTVELHGFDICDHQFPVKNLRPQNVSLRVLDSLVDPPASMCGQYDVVHLRMWASNLRENTISALVRHIKCLLKPGRYIQWEEADLVHQRVQGEGAASFEQNINDLFKKANLDYRWVSELPSFLETEKFKIIESDTGVFEHELVQLCTNTYLLALREILQGIKKILGQDLPLVIAEQELALYRLFLQNTRVVYNWSPVALLAQSQEVEV